MLVFSILVLSNRRTSNGLLAFAFTLNTHNTHTTCTTVQFRIFSFLSIYPYTPAPTFRSMDGASVATTTTAAKGSTQPPNGVVSQQPQPHGNPYPVPQGELQLLDLISIRSTF